MLDAIGSDVDNQSTIAFNGVEYPFNRDMLVDGELYGQADQVAGTTTETTTTTNNTDAVVSHTKCVALPSAMTHVGANYSLILPVSLYMVYLIIIKSLLSHIMIYNGTW